MRPINRVLAIALLSVLPILNAQPAPAWYDVEINMAGMSANGTLFIRVTDMAATPAFTNLWLIGNPGLSREMLATALAAMTNDMVAFVNTDPAAGGFPLANNLYLKK
jgi:hypothetical protein